MPLDKDEEIFEVVDSNNNVVGRRRRGDCHKHGIAHRAVYCLVFDKDKRLLLQKRKKIGPEQWDLSLAEHLQPGETYAQAVVRGLQEELGIHVPVSAIEGPLAPCHRRELHVPGLVHDVEYVECFRLSNWAGELKVDEDEVQAVRWIDINNFYLELEKAGMQHTEWLKAELISLKPELLSGCSTG